MVARALIYTRVSQDRAAGRSPAEQEAEARAHCGRQGWEVVEVVTDSVGASRHSKGTRAGWRAARDLLASGSVDVLVTWEASRAQRDLAAYAQLRDLCVEHRVLWSYSGRTHDLADKDDRFRTGLDALLAELEVDTARERVLRAVRANAAAGRPHGRRLFGYRRIYDPSTGILLGQEPHPVEALIVERVFADYLAGHGYRTIARRLNAESVTTGTGGRWVDGQVKRLLTNAHYAGRRVHLGVVGPGTWPPLVPVDTWDKVQARVEVMSQRGERQRFAPRLLTGVGRCGVCGAKVKAVHDRDKRKVYACGERFCVARDERHLDGYIRDVLLARLEVGDVAVPDLGPDVSVARSKAAVLHARLEDATSEFVAGRLSASVLGRIEAELRTQIDRADRDARRALVPFVLDIPTSDLGAWWDHTLTAEQRRELVAHHIAAVVILPTGKGRGRFRLDESAIRIEPRRL